MKKIISIALIAAALIGSLQLTKVKADESRARRQVDVVIIQATEDFMHDTNGQLIYLGYVVYNSSCSSNTAQIPRYPKQGPALAQCLSDLLSDGYRINQVSDNQMKWTLIRTR